VIDESLILVGCDKRPGKRGRSLWECQASVAIRDKREQAGRLGHARKDIAGTVDRALAFVKFSHDNGARFHGFWRGSFENRSECLT
jgi:hypothetical protein